MEIRPLSDHIVVKVIAEEKTVAGIVLPDTAHDKWQRAEVVAVGSGRLLENGARAAMEVAVGDAVLYSADAGLKVRIDDADYLLLREADVLAVFATASVVH